MVVTTPVCTFKLLRVRYHECICMHPPSCYSSLPTCIMVLAASTGIRTMRNRPAPSDAATCGRRFDVDDIEASTASARCLLDPLPAACNLCRAETPAVLSCSCRHSSHRPHQHASKVDIPESWFPCWSSHQLLSSCCSLLPTPQNLPWPWSFRQPQHAPSWQPQACPRPPALTARQCLPPCHRSVTGDPVHKRVKCQVHELSVSACDPSHLLLLLGGMQVEQHV